MIIRAVLSCEALGQCVVARAAGVEAMNALPRWTVDVLSAESDVDLEALILNWGPCPNCPFLFGCSPAIAPPGVPPGDCEVNVNDLLMVITNWGACP